MKEETPLRILNINKVLDTTDEMLKALIKANRERVAQAQINLVHLIGICKRRGHVIVPRDPDIYEKLKTDIWASTGALCRICGNGATLFHFGWYCPKSPDGLCNYKQPDGSYNDDNCVYCGMPSERK